MIQSHSAQTISQHCRILIKMVIAAVDRQTTLTPKNRNGSWSFLVQSASLCLLSALLWSLSRPFEGVDSDSYSKKRIKPLMILYHRRPDEGNEIVEAIIMAVETHHHRAVVVVSSHHPAIRLSITSPCPQLAKKVRFMRPVIKQRALWITAR